MQSDFKAVEIKSFCVCRIQRYVCKLIETRLYSAANSCAYSLNSRQRTPELAAEYNQVSISLHTNISVLEVPL